MSMNVQNGCVVGKVNDINTINNAKKRTHRRKQHEDFPNGQAVERLSAAYVVQSVERTSSLTSGLRASALFLGLAVPDVAGMRQHAFCATSDWSTTRRLAVLIGPRFEGKNSLRRSQQMRTWVCGR